jgi:hypothetical protein
MCKQIYLQFFEPYVTDVAENDNIGAIRRQILRFYGYGMVNHRSKAGGI